MTEAERVDFLIMNLESNNANEFSRKTGIPKTMVSQMRHGKARLASKIDIITNAYPAIRREWLETGEGYPGDFSIQMVRDRYEKMVADRDAVIKTLTDTVARQQELIAKLMQ